MSNEEQEEPLDEELTKRVDKETDEIIEHLESQLGDDVIPYFVIMIVKVAVKYKLDINWICRSIQVGYYNKDGPQNFTDKTDEKGKVIFDS